MPDSRTDSCCQAYGDSVQSMPARRHTVTPHQAAELTRQPRINDDVSANPGRHSTNTVQSTYHKQFN